MDELLLRISGYLPATPASMRIIQFCYDMTFDFDPGFITAIAARGDIEALKFYISKGNGIEDLSSVLLNALLEGQVDFIKYLVKEQKTLGLDFSKDCLSGAEILDMDALGEVFSTIDVLFDASSTESFDFALEVLHVKIDGVDPCHFFLRHYKGEPKQHQFWRYITQKGKMVCVHDNQERSASLYHRITSIPSGFNFDEESLEFCKELGMLWTQEAFDIAAVNFTVSALKWMAKNHPELIAPRHIAVCGIYGRLQNVKFLMDFCRAKTLELVAKGGTRARVEEEEMRAAVERLFPHLVIHDHIHILEYLYEVAPESFNVDAINKAVLFDETLFEQLEPDFSKSSWDGLQFLVDHGLVLRSANYSRALQYLFPVSFYRYLTDNQCPLPRDFESRLNNSVLEDEDKEGIIKITKRMVIDAD